MSDRALFTERNACIACGSEDLESLARARFGDPPVADFIAADPWGTSPLPRVADEEWNLVECRACAQRFHRRILAPAWEETLFSEWMSKAAIHEFEERIGSQRPQARFLSARQKVRHVLRLEAMSAGLRRGEALRVLDFGCGWGHFLALASLFGAEAYGVDADADRREGAAGVNVRVVPRLADLDPELKGRLHAITLFQVLEHLPAPLQTLQELAGWLVPGGLLVLETPNCTGVKAITTPAEYRAVNPLSHINAFTPATLRAIAGRAGFRGVRPAIAQATASLRGVLKTEARRVLQPLLPSSTNQYFRRA